MLVSLACATFLSLAGPVDDLDSLLKVHFTAESSDERAEAAKNILAIKGLTTQQLGAAMTGLQLWDAHPTGEQMFDVQLKKTVKSKKHVIVRVPNDYDPARAWPLVITLHGQGGQAGGMLNITRQMLGNRADQFIIAAPQDVGPLGFTEPNDIVDQPRMLLYALRKIYHIDSDRVILTGYSLGGHNTWMAGVMHSDCFAALMPLATPLQVVGNDLIYDELLPNMRNVSILFCWGENDNLGQDGKPHPMGGNAEMNRRLTNVMHELKLKNYEGVMLPGVDHTGVVPPTDKLAALLDRKRLHWPKHVHQTYRLPEQSRAYWVESEGLQGEPLPNGEIKVPAKLSEDPLIARRNFVINKLGLIEGTVKDQTITLTTRRSTFVALLLSDEMIDLDKPITIIRNKKEVFTGQVPRDPSVMLREAAAGWDFARLPCARVIVPVGGKVKFGYPAPKEKKHLIESK